MLNRLIPFSRSFDSSSMIGASVREMSSGFKRWRSMRSCVLRFISSKRSGYCAFVNPSITQNAVGIPNVFGLLNALTRSATGTVRSGLPPAEIATCPL